MLTGKLMGGLVGSLLGGAASLTGGNSSNPGESGSGGSGAVLLVCGPLRLTPIESFGGDEMVARRVGDVFTLACWLMNEAGQTIPVGGVTLTSRIVDTRTGEAIGQDLPVTVLHASGLVQITVPSAATQTAGTKRITVLRDNGSSDRQTFGPLLLRVSPR